MNPTPIIVIGASTGGVDALKRLVARLPGDLPAALCVVLHMSPHHPTRLHEILSDNGPLPARLARDGDPIAPGTICVGVPDRHLLVKADSLGVVFGPRENRSRPSIDVLFRSAAAYHATRVTAVLLTGNLDDGVSGLAGVKRCGGVAIVQDPADCEAPDLPQAAIAQVPVDHILPLGGIAAILPEILAQPVRPRPEIPEEIREEVKVSEHEVPDLDHMQAMGEPTPYTCPECGGSLWKARNEPTRYICHTGHAFSQESYLNGQAEVIENSLWSAMRYVQERIDVLQKMSAAERGRGRDRFAAELDRKVADMKHHVLVVREFVMSGVLKDRDKLPAPALP